MVLAQGSSYMGRGEKIEWNQERKKGFFAWEVVLGERQECLGFSLKGFCKVHKSKRVCEIRINVAKHKKEEENKK